MKEAAAAVKLKFNSRNALAIDDESQSLLSGVLQKEHNGSRVLVLCTKK
jgi:hypothetical protein